VKAGILALLLALAGAAAWLQFGQRAVLPAGAAVSPQAPSFAPSMAGTRPDGAARANQDRLVVDQELGYLFDYYLAGMGERDLAAIRAGIGRELDQRLAPAAAAQARRLLDNYLRYKEALAGVEQGLKPGPDMVANLRARRDAMLKLRRDYFSDGEIAGLFGLSDARDADALARMEIMRDTSLDAAGREQRLATLDKALPPALREERNAPTQLLRLEHSVGELRAAGADDNAVYRLRADQLSPAAADRLAQVDREETEWTARIAAWKEARRQASPAEAQHLRDRYFNQQEQKRLAAFE
jgi:lipase chaperone LimK